MGSSTLDRVGIWASAACAVHCFAAPLLFLLAPAFTDIWAHPASHVLIALFVLPLAATVLLRGYRVHQRKWILVTTSLGVFAILVGCVLPYVGTHVVEAATAHGAAIAGEGAASTACNSCCPSLETSPDGETSLKLPPASIATILGSFFLIVSHAGNLSCCRSCR